MATYLLVNVIFTLILVVLFRVRRRHMTKAFFITLVALLTLTAIFDSIIVGLNIVGYDEDLILGIYVGKAPIEDFFYAIIAVMIVPRLWELMETKHD